MKKLFSSKPLKETPKGGVKMKKAIFISIFLFLSLMCAQRLFSHCEIPCGIYNDEMRVTMMKEHVTTIEKSMKMIARLSKEEDKNYNQIVRWVNNKQKHANYIRDIVSQYFMTQRIKPVAKKDTAAYQKYIKQITLLHQMLVYAMKAKQSTNLNIVKELRSVLSSFKSSYFGHGG